ncbi:MAG: hypothetical protein LBD21_04340 [Tannerellaceae bacterium]|jgi:hypothetical protein|nr:hypothetical protein [Tannerellaceae bacterium]
MDERNTEIHKLGRELEKLVQEERVEQERERFETIRKLYNDFIEGYPDIKSFVYLNEDLLCLVMARYFDDIYRFKLYSHSERADRHKQAAYSIKWLSRIRPIQLLPGTKATKEFLFINASFAIIVGVSFLELNVFEAIDFPFYKHLLLDIQYGEISGKKYATLMYTIEEMAKKQSGCKPESSSNNSQTTSIS